MNKDLENFCILGEKIYSELIKHKEIQFIVCPCSLGDTVNVGAFLKTYKKIHDKEKVILVVKEHQAALAGIFSGSDGTFELSETEMMGLRFYMSVYKLEKEGNVLYGYFRMKEDDLWGTSNRMFVNFVDEYKSLVLDIPPESVIDSVRLEKVEDENRFRDTVLFMPFCQGTWRCSDEFWNGLIRYYKENGIKKIYSNVGNPSDHAIEGTEGLSLSASELLAYSHQFKKIIGLRGGIFDVLALRSDVRLDVITPGIESRFWGRCEIDTVRHPLYFGLKNLNPDAKVREYTFAEGCEETLIREINREDAVY